MDKQLNRVDIECGIRYGEPEPYEVDSVSGKYVLFDELEELFEYRVKWLFWETEEDCRPYYKETSTACDDDDWHNTKEGAIESFKTRFEEQCNEAIKDFRWSNTFNPPKNPVLEVRIKLTESYDFSKITDRVIIDSTNAVTDIKRQNELQAKWSEEQERATYERLKKKYEST